MSKSWIKTTLGLLLTLVSFTYAARTQQVTFVSGDGNFNVGEDVELLCDVTSDEPLLFGFGIEWLKKQDDGWLQVWADSQLQQPFAGISDKYFGSSTPGANDATASLKIMGLDTADTGHYVCRTGYLQSDVPDFTDSNHVQIITKPVSESNKLTLSPSAPADGSEIKFNIAQMIDCGGEVSSLTPHLDLIVKLDDVMDISQDFKLSRSTIWSGDVAGLKTPTLRIQLMAAQWLPERAGKYRISCILQDGDKQLAIQTLPIVRDETASLECKSNYKKPVKIDDIDVIITCNVLNYDNSLDGVELVWKFPVGEENITLIAPETLNLRKAIVEGEDFNLVISRVTAEMVATGKAFDYTVVLRHKDDGADIASTVYPLAIDSTRRYSAASYINYSAGLLLITSLIALMS